MEAATTVQADGEHEQLEKTLQGNGNTPVAVDTANGPSNLSLSSHESLDADASYLATTLASTPLNASHLHAPMKPNIGSAERVDFSAGQLAKNLIDSITPEKHQFATPVLATEQRLPKKTKSPFSIDNLLADRMKVMAESSPKLVSLDSSNGTTSTAPNSNVPSTSTETLPKLSSTLAQQFAPPAPSSANLPPNGSTEMNNMSMQTYIEQQPKKFEFCKTNNRQDSLNGTLTPKKTIIRNPIVNMAPPQQPQQPNPLPPPPNISSTPQNTSVAPIPAPPATTSTPVTTPEDPPEEMRSPTPDPVIEVVRLPLTGYRLKKYLAQQEKNRIQSARGVTVFWSKTVMYPKKGKVYKKYEYYLPDPPVEEEKPPVEEPEPPRIIPSNLLENFSVDTIFLALTQENPYDAIMSGKSLEDLVREKKEELDALGLSETSSNTGEDSRYAAQDMKKLEEEIKKDEESFKPEKPEKPVTLLQHVENGVQPPKARGRPRNDSKTFKKITEIDTDYSEDNEEDEDEEEEDDDDFDIHEAVREIDKAHSRGKEGRKLAPDVESDAPTACSRDSQESRSLKRKPTQEISNTEPKQRRSTRIKNNTAKMDEFLYDSAVTTRSDAELPSRKSQEEDKPKSKNNKSKTARSKSQSTSEKEKQEETPEPPPAVPDPDPDQLSATAKKTRANARAEHYSRRVSHETVGFLLSQILIPAPPEKCEILDYFKAPIVRRAIVNRNTLCYAISMLQLLLRVPQIYSIIRSHSHDVNIGRRGCFICMMANIISERPRFDDYPSFIAIMRSTWKDVEVDKMHCVMEAMQHFFNKFDEEYMLDHPEFAGKLPTQMSPIRSFFEIEIINEYRCKECVHLSRTTDKAVYISIDLTKKSDGTMQNLVDNMGNPTAVHGMECPVCECEEFTCTTHFKKLPEVLLYFVPRVRTRKREKDMTVVQVQKQLILKDEESEHKYALCAFLTHSGITGNKGHYKAFEVDRAGGRVQYNEFDDARVVMNSKLSCDITVVLAMFRKEAAVAKDAETDMIFDGRGNIQFAHEKHCKQE